MKITVFGGSAPKSGEPAYQEAYRLGQLLGQGGHTALTGGYIGTMEAISRGCAEVGGHVIGITCDEIENWRGVEPNRWVIEERRFKTVRQRLFALLESCDAALALPGGVGTLAEIATMWNQMQTQAMPVRPLILIGSGWQDTFETMFEQFSSYTPPDHRQLVSFAPDVKSSIEILTKQLPA